MLKVVVYMKSLVHSGSTIKIDELMTDGHRNLPKVTPSLELNKIEHFNNYDKWVVLPDGNIATNKHEITEFFADNKSYLNITYLLVPEIDNTNEKIYLKFIPIPETA